MVTFMLMLNLIINWLVIAFLFITASVLSTNTYDLSIIACITTLTMGLVVLYTLSPFAEKRRRKPYRRPTKEEYALIYPIFMQIFNRVDLEKPPVLLISDDMEANAMVLSPVTMVLNIGLINRHPEQEIAAIIAHEFGHIINGDAKLKLIEYAINRTSDLILGFMIVVVATVSDNGQRIVFLPLVIIAAVFKLIQWLLLKILLLGHLVIDRQNEYKADAFVKELGLGNHLISFFGKEKEIKTFPLLRTHPLLKNRIEKLKYY